MFVSEWVHNLLVVGFGGLGFDNKAQSSVLNL